MKTVIILISTFLIIGTTFAKNAEQIYKEKSTAILRMGFVDPKGNFSSIGTGFFIDHNGSTYILTNRHVIDGMEYIIKKYSPMGLVMAAESINKNRYSNLRVLGTHKFADVGYLKMDNIQNGDTTLKISEETPKTGTDVFLIGNPREMYFSITSGILSRQYNEKTQGLSLEVSRIQFTTPSLPGTSGSPILNKDGEVIGINSHGRIENLLSFSPTKRSLVEIRNMYARTQGYATGYAAKHLMELDLYNLRNSNLAQIEYPKGKIEVNQIQIDEKVDLSNFELNKFPFPKELNMRMYSVSGGVYEYVGKSSDGHDVQIRYSKKAGTDAQFSDWNKVNQFVQSENSSLKANGKVMTYPITDSGVFHVKSTVTMDNGNKVKFLRIFPGNDTRFDLMVYSKNGDFDKVNVVVEKFMNKLRDDKAFSHLIKGKRNISNI